jgi:hypothetical protein
MVDACQCPTPAKTTAKQLAPVAVAFPATRYEMENVNLCLPSLWRTVRSLTQLTKTYVMNASIDTICKKANVSMCPSCAIVTILKMAVVLIVFLDT